MRIHGGTPVAGRLVAAFAVGMLLAGLLPTSVAAFTAPMELSAQTAEPGAAAAEGAVAGTVASGPRGRLDVGWDREGCFVPADGTARCWGYDVRGDGADFIRATPARALGVFDAVTVSSNYTNGCVLRATGNVACWGDNTFGQLGTGSAGGSQRLATATLVTGAVQMHLGFDFGCALLANGTVTCWGENDYGQLGDGQPIGSSQFSATPKVVTGITSAVQLSVGFLHACVVLADGTARCWGNNHFLPLGGPVPNGAEATSTPVAVSGLSGVRSISAGGVHTCALLTNGTAMCWGDNARGEIGNGAKVPGTPVVSPMPVVGLSGIAVVETGYRHTCALLATGAVRCWGRDTEGQLGDGQTADSSTPVSVNVGAATDISAGSDTSCAELTNATVSCWGYNDADQLGRRTAQAYPNPPGLVAGDLAPGEVQAGSGFSCAVNAARTVRCWGAGNLGQLGDGVYHTGAHSAPVAVSNLTGVVAISAGTNHGCAITTSGRGYCWGDNTYGQLGNHSSGPGVKSNVPVPVVDASSVAVTDLVAISAGGSDTCALRRSQAIVCWGNNVDAVLGNGTGFSTTPQPYAGANVSGGKLWASVSVGSRHACAIETGGAVWCWGDNSNQQLGVPWPPTPWAGGPVRSAATATDVVARYQYSCGLHENGTVECWGWSGYGVLGHPGLSDTATPVAVDNVTTAIAIGPSSNHGVHTCAVLANGGAMCWGANDQGQLGDGSTSANEATPVGVLGLANAIQVSVGYQHTCARLTTGTVRCWGNNTSGQIGSTAASPVTSPSTVTGFAPGVAALAVDAGSSHTCALLAGGTARCWGSNGSGRLGDGTTTNRSKPVAVSGLSGATAISAGGSHTCALVAAGTARCWGANTYGQLGNNSTTSHSTPVTVSGLSGAIAISAGGNHSCALLSNGTVKCWGLNSSGQLGDGTTTSRHTPVTVKTSSSGTLTGVVAISAGTSHTCALLSNGTARCWGAGANGRLGNGSTANHTYAVSVSGVTTATAVAMRFASISAGGAHTCARLANGTAKCWGAGGSGRLGNASTADHSTPVTVSSLSSVAQVSAGGAHTCALISNGTAKCWGSNAYGQLGINTTSSHSTPVTVSGLAGAISISAGGNQTAASLATGSLRAWGLNTSGQVGDGTTTNRLTPRTVSGF